MLPSLLALLALGQDGTRLARPGGEPAELNRSEVLRPTFRAQIHGGVVTAGCGFRGSGPPEARGTIAIAGIPPGATIVKAILNWTVMGGMWPADRAVLEPPAGGPVVVRGEPLGEDRSPCWPLPFIYGFSADVCDAVAATGNGTYTVRVEDSGDLGTHPSAEGAALIVVWEDAASPARDIVIYEGLETQESGITAQTVSGFDAAAPVAFAQATFVVSDGQGDASGSWSRALVNGAQVIGPYFDGDEGLACTATDPRYYDVDTVDVSRLLAPGATSLEAVVESGPDLGTVDCLTWSAFVLSVASDTTPGFPASCPRPCPRLPVAQAGPDLAVCLGEVVTLDASASAGCPAGGFSYRWLEGLTPVCDWSSLPTCDVAPRRATSYRLEVSCRGGSCEDRDSLAVQVDPDLTPPDLGNSLRAVKVGFNVLLDWRDEPLARSYVLHRAGAKGSWPAPPHAPGLIFSAGVDVDALYSPPGLYFYRAAAASCAGREGP